MTSSVLPPSGVSSSSVICPPLAADRAQRPTGLLRRRSLRYLRKLLVIVIRQSVDRRERVRRIQRPPLAARQHLRAKRVRYPCRGVPELEPPPHLAQRRRVLVRQTPLQRHVQKHRRDA